MAARKKKTTGRRKKKTTGRRRAPRKAGGRRKKGSSAGRAASRRQSKAQMGVLERLESELPPTLRAFSRRVNAALTRLETEFDRGQANSRKRAARMLRETSRKLGRLEAEGEQGWQKLDESARKDAVRLLKKVEEAVAPSGSAAGQTTRKAARKATRKTRRAIRSVASTLEP
jgi:hypothetical protein